MAKTELIVALDLDDLDTAAKLIAAAGSEVAWYKIGKKLFTRFGPDAVKMLKAAGKKVFLDLKFHDIPNTVAGALAASAELGVDMVNVHASGGRAMMQAARQVLDELPAGSVRPLLIGVTVLTSMDKSSLTETLGIACRPEDQVLRLARLAQASGLDGVVASAHEIDLIRENCGTGFRLVIPGIRPAGSSLDDQSRVMTPAEAARRGADFIVMGRPILRASDPAAAAAAVIRDLELQK